MSPSEASGKVQRFEFDECEGSWVRYDDHARIVAELKWQTEQWEDAGEMVNFIFRFFGDVSMAHHLPDHIVTAVRRVEAALAARQASAKGGE
jgi:hypothetical protein